jgi:hypothetical protein
MVDIIGQPSYRLITMWETKGFAFPVVSDSNSVVANMIDTGSLHGR